MKKLLLLLSLFIVVSSLGVVAQPTLTSSTVPKIGDVISTTSVSATGLSQGPSGANQTWDFSGVTALGSGTENCVSPTGTTYASDYPSANVASSDGNGDFGYYNITSSEYDLLGAANSVGYATYSDGEKLLSFPFTYNNSYTDNFSGTGLTSYQFNRSGYIKVTADAYGTLKTPAGTFPNVLRVSMKEIYSDTFPSLGYGVDYVFQSYIWYTNGFNNALFSLAFDSTYFAGVPEPSQVASYSTTGPTGVNTITPDFSFNVFPNPTTGNIFISAAEGVKRVTVSNMLGENVIDMTEENSNPGNPIQISLADLPAGIYFCTISTPLGNATRKIVKE